MTLKILTALSAFAFAFVSGHVALAECGALWPAGSLVITATGDVENVKISTGKEWGTLFMVDNLGLPAKLPGGMLLDAFTGAKLATVQAGAIRVEAAFDLTQKGGGRRLNLSTDLGAGALGPIIIVGSVTLGATDTIYLHGGAIDQCSGSSAALRGGHVAIKAYLGGVGLHSEPVPQLLVEKLSGFSLLTLGFAGATIASAGRLPLEEFDHGRADSQDAIFTNGLLHIERTQ